MKHFFVITLHKQEKKHIDFGEFLFALYNLLYVLYMNGTVIRSLNLAVLILLITYYGIRTVVITNGKLDFSKMDFSNEFIGIARSIFVFLTISILKQSINLNLRLEYASFYLYLIVPWLFAFLWANNVTSENRMTYIYIMFARFVLSFTLNNLSNISLNAIREISFSNSLSSIFESSDAHCFFILMILFLYSEKKALAFVSGLLCMLSFKRLCFILTPVFFLGYKFFSNKKASKDLVSTSKIIFMVSPIIILTIVNNEEQINSMFGIDLNYFTTGRINLIKYVLYNMEAFDGFGAVSAFMVKKPWGTYHKIISMHCDVLQIFLETTILGLGFYINSVFNLVRKNMIVYILVLYFAIEMTVSHFIDFLAAWMLLYMVIIILNYSHSEKIQS